MKEIFRKFAQATAEGVGSPWAFIAGVLIVLLWAFAGPMFKYSDTWQLVINTGTTIATFLIVFLIQNTQNRDARVIHLKLDELIRALQTARTEMVSMENASDEELMILQKQFEQLKKDAEEKLNRIRAKRPAGPGVETHKGMPR